MANHYFILIFNDHDEIQANWEQNVGKCCSLGMTPITIANASKSTCFEKLIGGKHVSITITENVKKRMNCGYQVLNGSTILAIGHPVSEILRIYSSGAALVLQSILGSGRTRNQATPMDPKTVRNL
jgi:hypothetical protein